VRCRVGQKLREHARLGARIPAAKADYVIGAFLPDQKYGSSLVIVIVVAARLEKGGIDPVGESVLNSRNWAGTRQFIVDGVSIA
jgi:hypothetical protein